MIVLIDKLYWISGSKPPTSSTEAFYFSVDNVSDASKNDSNEHD